MNKNYIIRQRPGRFQQEPLNVMITVLVLYPAQNKRELNFILYLQCVQLTGMPQHEMHILNHVHIIHAWRTLEMQSVNLINKIKYKGLII